MQFFRLPMRRGLFLILAFLLGSACHAVASEQGCNCAQLDTTFSPVCSNGITLANRCISECQGLNVEHDGACGVGLHLKSGPAKGGAPAAAQPQPVNYADANRFVNIAPLDAAILSRFSDAGYTFSATVRLDDSPVVDAMVSISNRGGDSAPKLLPNDQLLAARWTPEGHLYLKYHNATATSGLTSLSEALAQPHRPQAPTTNANMAASRNSGGRKLKLWGGDDRYEVDTTSWPWSAVGYINSCSAALITPRAVLTAGHCVYNTTSREMKKVDYFYPNLRGGRYNRKIPVIYITTYFNNAGKALTCPDTGKLKCQDMEDFVYDFAIITLGEDASEFGDLGFSPSCKTQSYSVATAGYPGDKEKYHMWANEGRIDAFNDCLDPDTSDPTSHDVVATTLDIYSGQSGSAVWDVAPDKEGIIRGIVVSSNSDGVGSVRTMSNWVAGLINDELEQIDSGLRD